MTQEQRKALDDARRLLSPVFPGETLRLYVPRFDAEQLARMREARNGRIARALEAGEKPPLIAQRERVSTRLVRIVRGRLGTSGAGDGNDPP